MTLSNSRLFAYIRVVIRKLSKKKAAQRQPLSRCRVSDILIFLFRPTCPIVHKLYQCEKHIQGFSFMMRLY